LIAATDLDDAKTALEAIGYEARLAPFPVARGRFRIQRFLRTEAEDLVLVGALLADGAAEIAMLGRRLALDSEGGRLCVVTSKPSPQQVEQTLRRVAQLRTLFRRLPHLPSPREARRVANFEAFLAGLREECSREVLDAGVRAAFRRGDARAILVAAERLGALRDDPPLHPYYYWAQAVSRVSAAALLPPESPRE
jgi:hypothetical protein